MPNWFHIDRFNGLVKGSSRMKPIYLDLLNKQWWISGRHQWFFEVVGLNSQVIIILNCFLDKFNAQ